MQLSDYIYWIDANLPLKSAIWLHHAFGVKVTHVSQIDFLTTTDDEIFQQAAASKDSIIIITKDEDFVELVLRKKSPPKIVWITAGNLSNNHLKKILLEYLPEAVEKLSNSDYFFVEIG